MEEDESSNAEILVPPQLEADTAKEVPAIAAVDEEPVASDSSTSQVEEIDQENYELQQSQKLEKSVEVSKSEQVVDEEVVSDNDARSEKSGLEDGVPEAVEISDDVKDEMIVDE